MKKFYGLSRTRNCRGEIIRRTLRPIVNCLHGPCGYKTMQVLIVEAIFNEEECIEVRESVEIQPERLGVPDGGGVSPCLNCGAHHGCEPKIIEINVTQVQEPGVDGRATPCPD